MIDSLFGCMKGRYDDGDLPQVSSSSFPGGAAFRKTPYIK